MKLGKYKHYKGGTVEVLSVAHHSETLEEMVVYKCMYESGNFGIGSIWVRPKKMFLENVVIEGRTIPRFEQIND